MSERKKRFGLFKIFVGTTHMVKGPDGVQRQFRVQDKTRVNEKKAQCVCIACQKSFDSEDAMRLAHAEEAVLRKQQEPHPYGWWSNRPRTEGDTDPGRVVGLLSDAYIED